MGPGTCNGDCPLNGPGTAPDASARWPWSAASIQAVILNCSDLMRTYDMIKAMSVSEVIDRQYKLLNKSAHWPVDEHSADRNFDGSGEPMVTAALGGVIQPMDSTAFGLGIPDAFQVKELSIYCPPRPAPPRPRTTPFPGGKIHTRGNIWSFTVG